MLKGIYRVTGPDITDYRDCNAYLIDSDEPVLIDAGFGAAVDKMLNNITTAGVQPKDISKIVLTHCHVDHIYAARRLRDLLGAPLVMHELDAAIVERGDNRLTAAFCFEVQFDPLIIDEKLRGPEGTISLKDFDLHFLHTPGHTPGSISLYFDAGGKRVLFGQDLGAPLLEEFDCDPAAWRSSIEKLLALDADVLCDGHSGVYQPAERVKAYIRHFMKAHEEGSR